MQPNTMPGKDDEMGHSVKSDEEVKQSLLMADESSPLQAQHFSVGIGTFWQTKKTRAFTDNMGLAVRGGLYILVLGLPFMLEPSYLPDAWNYLRGEGIITSVSIVMFIFTLYKSVGETVTFAWQGMAGTIACSLTVWLMFQLFPGGVTPDAPPHYFWCGAAIGLAFTLLTLGLNVSVLAQIFALSNFVWFYMSFMTGKSAGFSANWEIDTQGAAVSNVLVSFAGVMFAVLAALFPWPILAIRKAQDGAEIITTDTCAIWSRAAKLFCAQGTHAYERDVLARTQHELQVRLAGLGGAIEASWWECFGMGSWQRARMTLAGYARKMAENHERLPSVVFACEHNDGSKSHSDLMDPLKEHIDVVLVLSQMLYQKVTMAAVGGGIVGEEEDGSMRESVKKTEESIESLAHAFARTKRDLGLALVNSDQIDEHAFCYNICAHGRLACEMAKELITLRKKGKDPKVAEVPVSIFALSVLSPRAILAPAHLSFFARNSITIVLCFIVGYLGFPPPTHSLIKEHSPGVASTAGILISLVKPSMTSNLDRLQGVVLGTVVGQLVFNSLGYCTWWGYLGIALALFGWTTGTLYMYYNSVKYGVVGCLLAAFGAQNFLQGCTDDFSKPAHAYHSIVDCVAAIFIIIGVDVLVSNTRSSDEAYTAYLDFWQSLRRSVEGILDPNSHTAKADHAALLSKVQHCELLNRLATEEPRWWRTPWRKVAFADGIACATKLRLALKTMEDSIPGQDICEADGASNDGASTGASSEVLDRMMTLESFGRMRDGVSGQFEQLEVLIRIFVHERACPMKELQHINESRRWAAEVRVATEDFMTEAIAKKILTPGEVCTSLEDDDTCEVSLFLSSIDDMMTAMHVFQRSILRHG